MDRTVREMEGTGRVKVLYFERLKEDLPAELDVLVRER